MHDGRKTVALLIPTLEQGGAERQALAIQRGLTSEWFRSILVTLHPPRNWQAASCEHDTTDIVSLDGKQPLARLLGLVRFLRRERVGLLHSFLESGNAYAAAAERLVPGVKVIVGIRQSHVSSGGAWKGKLIRRMSQWACRKHLAVCNSETGRRELLRREPAARTMVIPNGIDTHRFAPDAAARAVVRGKLGVKPGDLIVGTVANFSSYKDYPYTIGGARVTE